MTTTPSLSPQSLIAMRKAAKLSEQAGMVQADVAGPDLKLASVVLLRSWKVTAHVSKRGNRPGKLSRTLECLGSHERGFGGIVDRFTSPTDTVGKRIGDRLRNSVTLSHFELFRSSGQAGEGIVASGRYVW